ncbi:IS3 family transposase [Paenibacillus larvae]|uniref:IS3 family transposase n=1 Tax=Paenibacillus larvae TaxID=1464 RepID=UPI0037C9C426
MTQSMSRSVRCIDNGPMESFWGMMKSKSYYLRKFYTYEELEATVIEYIDYYNTRRYQKKTFNCMTPLEYRQYLHKFSSIKKMAPTMGIRLVPQLFCFCCLLDRGQFKMPGFLRQ